MRDEATFQVKTGLAEMLKGGVIMDVVTPEQAKVAEDAGAVSSVSSMARPRPTTAASAPGATAVPVSQSVAIPRGGASEASRARSDYRMGAFAPKS